MSERHPALLTETEAEELAGEYWLIEAADGDLLAVADAAVRKVVEWLLATTMLNHTEFCGYNWGRVCNCGLQALCDAVGLDGGK